MGISHPTKCYLHDSTGTVVATAAGKQSAVVTVYEATSLSLLLEPLQSSMAPCPSPRCSPARPHNSRRGPPLHGDVAVASHNSRRARPRRPALALHLHLHAWVPFRLSLSVSATAVPLDDDAHARARDWAGDVVRTLALMTCGRLAIASVRPAICSMHVPALHWWTRRDGPYVSALG